MLSIKLIQGFLSPSTTQIPWQTLRHEPGTEPNPYPSPLWNLIFCVQREENREEH